ncbi:MAG: hypothetical protein FWD57_14265 [Polyangiaceae bacterium]|nr:hypothetical protein [Polyangiaceae bacterium]
MASQIRAPPPVPPVPPVLPVPPPAPQFASVSSDDDSPSPHAHSSDVHASARVVSIVGGYLCIAVRSLGLFGRLFG